jgi:DNA repair exonuclease SbcCD ATPase subunit
MNAWGRSDMTAPRRRSPWPFSFGLVVGAALVAGIFFFGPGNIAVLFGRDNAGTARLQARIAELQDQVERASGPRDASPQVDALKVQLASKADRIAELEKAMAELRAGARDDSQNLAGELQRLKKESEASRSEAEHLRANLKLAENVTGQLQAQYDKAVNEDIPALKAEIEKRDAELKVLNDEIARFSAAGNEQHKPDAAAGDAAARVQALTAEVAARDAELKKLDAEIGRLSSVDRQLREARGEIAALKAEKGHLEETVATLSKRKEDRPLPADTGSEEGQQTRARQPTPRDPLRVARAMSEVHGLENLSNDQRDRLGTGLIEGACVSKALADVFGKAPAVTMRDLIQALDSDC